MTEDQFDDDILDEDLAEELGSDEARENGTNNDSEGESEEVAPTRTEDDIDAISDFDSDVSETSEVGGIEVDTSDSTQRGDESYFAIAKSKTRASGAWIGGTIAMGILLPMKLAINGVVGTARGFTRVIPGSQRIWKRVMRIGYNGYYKTSGADMIGHVMKEGRLKHAPLTWNNDHNRFEGPDDSWWLAPGENEHTLLGPGNTPCAWATSKATNLGTQVQAEYAEALDIGLGTAVYRDANVTFLTMEEPSAASGGQTAVADGGGVTQHISVENPGVLEDYVVPTSPLYEDDDGTECENRLISTWKYYETYPETVDSEEMKKQEDRGRLAEMDRGKAFNFAIKMMLLAALIIGIVVLGPDVVRFLLGSGGGGGGGGPGLPGLMLSVSG